MNDCSDSQSRIGSSRSLGAIILAFILAHGLLLWLGLDKNTSILSGDRAQSRDATIAYVFDVEKIGSGVTRVESNLTAVPLPYIGDRILNSGHAGDYLIQGAIIKLTSINVLVMFQLVLALLATLCVYALLKRINFLAKAATLGTVIYLLLPGSLLPAHQLSSEALFIPCAIIGCYLMIISSGKKTTDIAFVAGLLMLSVAIFVRPQLILFPFLLTIIYVCFSVKKLSTILLTIVPLSLFFTAIWTVFLISGNGRFTIGGDDHSIGILLHKTAEQMAMSGSFEFDSSVYQSGSMPLSDFAEIVADNPHSYFRQRTINMVNFIVNSGAYSLVVRHLNYIDSNYDKHYWQHLRARAGIYGSLVEILKRGPLFALLIFSTTIVWCFVFAAAIVGLFPFIRDKGIESFSKSLLLTLVAYQFGVVMLFSVGARWQHRSLMDFVIVLLAIYGVKKLHERLSYNRQVSLPIKSPSLERQQ